MTPGRVSSSLSHGHGSTVGGPGPSIASSRLARVWAPPGLCVCRASGYHPLQKRITEEKKNNRRNHFTTGHSKCDEVRSLGPQRRAAEVRGRARSWSQRNAVLSCLVCQRERACGNGGPWE